MTFTIESAKQWALDHATELDMNRRACEDQGVMMLNILMPAKAKELWDSGSWLSVHLKELGASQEQVEQIQFAAGQRAFAGCAWKASVAYANEFASTGDTEEKGGWDLAEKVHKEVFG